MFYPVDLVQVRLMIVSRCSRSGRSAWVHVEVRAAFEVNLPRIEYSGQRQSVVTFSSVERSWALLPRP